MNKARYYLISIQNYFGTEDIKFKLYDPIVTNFYGMRAESDIDDSIRDANVVVIMNDHKSLRGINVSRITQLTKRPLLIIDAWHSINDLDSITAEESLEVYRVGDGQK